MSQFPQEATAELVASTSHAQEVSANVTYFFTALLAAMILCLALEEKLHAKKSVIVGTFALVGLF
ncbi:MAG: hypothetical protein CMI32_00505, partial [Opitutales bacterium]|nr:hypothetical protein [Opitutales bacterium]